MPVNDFTRPSCPFPWRFCSSSVSLHARRAEPAIAQRFFIGDEPPRYQAANGEIIQFEMSAGSTFIAAISKAHVGLLPPPLDFSEEEADGTGGILSNHREIRAHLERIG